MRALGPLARGPLPLVGLAVIVLSVIIMSLGACTATIPGAPALGTSAVTTSVELTPGGPRASFVPELVGQKRGNYEATEPELARFEAAAGYLAYAQRHPDMSLPTPDGVDFGRNVVFAVAEMACEPGPPYLRLEGNQVIGGFADGDENVACDVDIEYHAVFQVSSSMLPND